MRIIAGKLRGRPLYSLPGMSVRPTGDRLKESLFNILAFRLPDSRFLDLYAGTGSIGLEACSRGASHVVFVEHHRMALNCLKHNISSCQLETGYTVLDVPVRSALQCLAKTNERFDLIFLDPPYQADLYDTTLEGISSGNLLAAGGWVIVEHQSKLFLKEAYGKLASFRRHLVGDSGLTFFE